MNFKILWINMYDRSIKILQDSKRDEGIFFNDKNLNDKRKNLDTERKILDADKKTREMRGNG